jgi:hypothetical protein
MEPLIYAISVNFFLINRSYCNFFFLQKIQVFCSGWQPDKYDFWIVIPPYNQYRQSGSPVPFNSIIGLKHQQTGRNLHSHGYHESPKTKQQEGK